VKRSCAGGYGGGTERERVGGTGRLGIVKEDRGGSGRKCGGIPTPLPCFLGKSNPAISHCVALSCQFKDTKGIDDEIGVMYNAQCAQLRLVKC
jgi:hypothetical protein